MPKVRITVVKRAVHLDLMDKHWNTERFPLRDGSDGQCDEFEDNQTFIVEDWPDKPDDFPCQWAWADIKDAVSTVLYGGGRPWMANDTGAIPCCRDGFRPVTFLVEPIEG